MQMADTHSLQICKFSVYEVVADQDQGLVWPCASRQAVDFACWISLFIGMTSLRFILRLKFEPQNLHADGQRALLNPKAALVM